MKRILPLLLILLLILTGCSAQNADSPAADAPTDTPLTGTSYVQIDVKDYGTIVAELYADTAPITVANFLSLVDSGFYDGLTFHRIISGFMIQGGDRTATARAVQASGSRANSAPTACRTT